MPGKFDRKRVETGGRRQKSRVFFRRVGDYAARKRRYDVCCVVNLELLRPCLMCTVRRLCRGAPVSHSMTDQGRVANPRPVATVKKLATGRVVQRQVVTRTVGHGETGFLGRSSDLDRSSENGYVFTRPVLNLQPTPAGLL